MGTGTGSNGHEVWEGGPCRGATAGRATAERVPPAQAPKLVLNQPWHGGLIHTVQPSLAAPPRYPPGPGSSPRTGLRTRATAPASPFRPPRTRPGCPRLVGGCPGPCRPPVEMALQARCRDGSQHAQGGSGGWVWSCPLTKQALPSRLDGWCLPWCPTSPQLP